MPTLACVFRVATLFALATPFACSQETEGLPVPGDGPGIESEAPVTEPRIIGGPVPGEPEGTVFAKFGTPHAGPFEGSIKASGKTIPAIFAGDGSVRVRFGGESPLPGATYGRLRPPSGDAALATLRGASPLVTARADEVLLAGLEHGPVRIVAREGLELSPGISIKKFGAIDGLGATIFFLATLQGKNVVEGNNAALCCASPDGSVQVLIREGQVLDGHKVRSIATLVGARGSLAEGRWRINPTIFSARVSFTDAPPAYYTIEVDDSAVSFVGRVASVGDTLTAPLAGAQVTSFGFPSYPVARLALKPGSGGVTKASDTVILRLDEELSVLAREGGTAPGPAGTIFKALGEPVHGQFGSTAFAATLAGGQKGASLWFARPFFAPQQLASVGSDAPGGGKFASFTTLVYPDGQDDGPLFVAKLAHDKAAGISAKNDTGLWASDANGQLTRLLRTGDRMFLGGFIRTLHRFTALAPAPGCRGVSRGYNTSGRVTVLCRFSDRFNGKLSKATAIFDFHTR